MNVGKFLAEHLCCVGMGLGVKCEACGGEAFHSDPLDTNLCCRCTSELQAQGKKDFFASCFECKATWESLLELQQDFLALQPGGELPDAIPHCPRCLHDW